NTSRRGKPVPHFQSLSELGFAAFDRLARQGDLIPVFREIRADTETPVSAFLKLPSPSHAFLLESVEGGQRWGRYSFLGDRPRLRVRQAGATTFVEEKGRRTQLGGRPLDALRQLLGRHRLAKTEGLPRSVGGLVGSLSYGAVQWFEPRVPQRFGPDPEFPSSEWMLTDRLIVFDNLSHRIKLLACAEPAAHATARAAYKSALEQVDQLQHALARPLPPPALPIRPTRMEDCWSRPGFLRAVERVREYIQAGDCMQAVISRRLVAQYRGEPFELYRRLRGTTPAPYLFYLRFGER